MTSTEAKWAERVREWRASGQTAEEFASGQDFEASTLRYWASRLKSDGGAKTGPVMARVVRRRGDGLPAARPAPEPAFEVVVGEARIVVRRGFDAELLRQVAAALRSTP